MKRVSTISDSSAGASSLHIRPIRETDEGALRKAFALLSPRSRYARFRGFIQLSDAQWKYLVCVDGESHVALVAVNAREEIKGVARFIRLSEKSSAEIAVTVADEFQRQGVGRVLVAALVPLARARGITDLIAFTSADNIAIARLLRTHGAESRGVQNGESIFTLSTKHLAA